MGGWVLDKSRKIQGKRAPPPTCLNFNSRSAVTAKKGFQVAKMWQAVIRSFSNEKKIMCSFAGVDSSRLREK